MIKINLLDNLLADPLVSSPPKPEIQARWAAMLADTETTQKRKITMCGCGNHPVNPKKDIYRQHNHWMAQQHPKTERRNSDLYGVVGIGASIKKYVPTYDFSGEEFETTAEELRKFKK
tara:strand:+ start:1033 stop:1386 length:354 start_codon:yes stop_codon:yes gene_type:complete